MKSYLYALLLVALATALVGILSPDGEKGGMGKHLRLLSSLLLICVLIAPLKSGIASLLEWSRGEIRIPGLEEPDPEADRLQFQEQLDNASREYICQMLTQTLEQEFSIPSGEVRCMIQWDGETPTLVTVVLSGSAIWKDPEIIEEYVSTLLDCPCQSAIE